jgi:transglutaminase-like putative cysteine protease
LLARVVVCQIPHEYTEKKSFMPRYRFAFFLVVLVPLLCYGQDKLPQQRHFVLHYAFKVKDVPAGKELRIWIPLIHSDAFQDVQVLSKEGDLKLHQSIDDSSANSSLVAEAEPTKTRDYKFAIEYDVVRFERTDLVDGKLAPGVHPQRSSAAYQAGFLQGDKLGPVTGPIAQIAADESKAAGTPAEKAGAIYEYLQRSLRYAPSAKDCCRGDASKTLDAKQGDSTDLTAVLVAMLRSQQIPARAAVGFQLPADKHSGELTSHFSWAEFYGAPMGWLPADLTAGVQHPNQRGYAFGSLDMNRIQVSVGRDLKLNPPQESGPLNFFVEPYVEVEGKPYSKVALDVSFHDAGASAADSPRH